MQQKYGEMLQNEKDRSNFSKQNTRKAYISNIERKENKPKQNIQKEKNPQIIKMVGK